MLWSLQGPYALSIQHTDLSISDNVRDQAILPVSPFQAVAPLAACLRQVGARSTSVPPAVLARTSLLIFLKEDVVTTPVLSVT